jgi:pimeloyl-ACP methyl ester carboxylesterase
VPGAKNSALKLMAACLLAPGFAPCPLVLLIPGVFGTPEPICNTLIARLRKEGYPILRMLAHPARFTQTDLYAIDPENIDQTVRLAAAEISLRAAECAQSTRDALAYVESRRPALAGTNVIGIGFSGGAMVMPTVLALQPERFSAAVLVGGGADWWLIQSRSNYADMIDALRIAWTKPPTEAQERQADAAYINAAPLDAYHTASLLRNTRTLLIQGDADLAVPSNLGDLLWERAGRPERWLDHSSHESLFLGLPLQFDRLMQWLASPVPDVPAR